MTRPAFVFETDERTSPLLACSGATLRLERFGLGTLVVYPREPEPSADPSRLAVTAVDAPIDSAPLRDLLQGRRRVTIVFGDATEPRPRMRFDIRRDLIERILELCARVGVNDVELVCANGLHRRMTYQEFAEMLGGRVARSFLPDRLLNNHDVCSEGLVTIGEVDGHEVRLNERVATSDLVISLFVRSGLAGSASRQLVEGLTDVETIDFVNGLEGRAHPERATQVADLIAEHVDVFGVEVVLATPLLGGQLGFVGKREWEWNLADQARYIVTRQLLSVAPKQASQRLVGELDADYAVLDIIAGNPRQASEQGRQVWHAAHAVEVPRSADVLVAGTWALGSDPTDPSGSPLAAAHDVLVHQAGVCADRPLVRDGGVLIGFHPLTHRFSNRHHSASADFFADVLHTTTDVAEMRARFQDSYAQDPWYLELYRRQYAFHPLQVFHDWYATSASAARLADVIWVGGDRRVAEVLGHRAASTLADALEIAANAVGRQPRITYLHGPGRVVGELS